MNIKKYYIVSGLIHKEHKTKEMFMIPTKKVILFTIIVVLLLDYSFLFCLHAEHDAEHEHIFLHSETVFCCGSHDVHDDLHDLIHEFMHQTQITTPDFDGKIIECGYDFPGTGFQLDLPEQYTSEYYLYSGEKRKFISVDYIDFLSAYLI